jgi:hypothetical protein
MIYRFLILLLGALTFGCSSNDQTGTKPQTTAGTPTKPILPHRNPEGGKLINVPKDPNPSVISNESLKPPVVKNDNKVEDDNSKQTKSDPQVKPKKEEPTYTFPQHAEWKNTFESNPELMALYEESVTSYLKGVQNNLNTQPKLMIKEHMVAHVYGEKVYNTFYESPEFAEFCKTSFKKSAALKTFLSKNKKRIIWD